MRSQGMSTYRVVRLSIIIVWVLVMGILVQRTYFNASESYINTHRSEHQLRPREEWMGIYWGEDKVGYTVSKIKKAFNGYVIHEQGITPDIPVNMSEEEERFARLRLAPGAVESLDDEDERNRALTTPDPQYERALDLLKGVLLFSKRAPDRLPPAGEDGRWVRR